MTKHMGRNKDDKTKPDLKMTKQKKIVLRIVYYKSKQK